MDSPPHFFTGPETRIVEQFFDDTSPVFRGQLRTWGGNSPRGGFLPPLKIFYEGGGDFSPLADFLIKVGEL